jgi:hypothetical protein
MKRNRSDRNKDFKDFYENSYEIFKQLETSDKSTTNFSRENSLCVCHGSRGAKKDKRVVEVFWGGKIFDFETGKNNWNFFTEEGVTLLIYKNDKGYVSVILFPAKTEAYKPIEDNIILYKKLDPKKLKKNRFIKSLWNDFNAYMECTCLDGNPSLKQKITIRYFREMKHLTVNKIYQPRRMTIYVLGIIKFTFTVGLSGFILFIIGKYFR